MIFQSRFISFNKVIVSNVSNLPNFSLSGRCVLVPRIYEGDAPKGQGESEYTENGACYAVYSPRPRFASATPLINEGGKSVCVTARQTAI